MGKTRNMTFIALCALMLLVVIGYLASGAAGVVDVPKKSSLEGRAYAKLPDLNAESVAEGEFQDQVESFLSDHVPDRDGVALGNAALQRSTIALANIPFNWESCPTFFGSTFSAVPSRNALVVTAKSPRKRDVEAAENWAASINGVAAAHPDVTFVYDIIDDTYTSPANPTHSLVADAWTREWIEEHLANRLDGGISVIYDGIESEDELFDEWFRTEHHWQLKRAVSSYNKISQILNWNEVSWDHSFTVAEEWYGSSARSGLDLQFHDDLIDIPADYSHLECSIKGEPANRGKKQEEAAGGSGESLFEKGAYNVFSEYYGGIKSGVVWKNTAAPNEKTCLFVEQSYGPPLEPYVAQNYAKTICVDPVNTKNSKSINDYIEKNEVSEVVIQLGVRDLFKIAEKSPGWISQ